MTLFALIHGGGDSGWYWHLVVAELKARGHDAVAPTLPADDSAGWDEYADCVVDAIGDRERVIVVGQSYGGFTVPLVAARRPVDALVLVAGMIPAPGETPNDWWDNTGYVGSGIEDPFEVFYHDVPRPLAEEAMRREHGVSKRPYGTPWPLPAWPAVPTRFVLCTEDRFFPPEFFRRLVAERLGIEPDEIVSGHCPALSRPAELADLLAGYARLSPA